MHLGKHHVQTCINSHLTNRMPELTQTPRMMIANADECKIIETTWLGGKRETHQLCQKKEKKKKRLG